MREEGTNVRGSSDKGVEIDPEGRRGDLVDGPVQRQATPKDRDENRDVDARVLLEFRAAVRETQVSERALDHALDVDVIQRGDVFPFSFLIAH